MWLSHVTSQDTPRCMPHLTTGDERTQGRTTRSRTTAGTQYMEVSYRREEKRRDAPSHQHHRRRKTHGYAVWLPRRAQQTGGLREGHITGSRASGRRRDEARLQAANIARDGRHMEATQSGGRWTGLMKWIRACVVDPSLGVHFSPTSHGEDGCFVPPQVACARTE